MYTNISASDSLCVIGKGAITDNNTLKLVPWSLIGTFIGIMWSLNLQNDFAMLLQMKCGMANWISLLTCFMKYPSRMESTSDMPHHRPDADGLGTYYDCGSLGLRRPIMTADSILFHLLFWATYLPLMPAINTSQGGTALSKSRDWDNSLVWAYLLVCNCWVLIIGCFTVILILHYATRYRQHSITRYPRLQHPKRHISAFMSTHAEQLNHEQQ